MSLPKASAVGAATGPVPGRARNPGEHAGLKWAAFLWIAAVAGFHLACAAAGYSFYRDIHLGAALEYAAGSIDLLRPVIVGFNLNGAPTPQELPLWQAAAAAMFKLLGTWFGWANLVSLLFFFSCLYPLFRLAERFGGRACRWWTMILFLSQPLVFIYAGEASPDGQALAAAVWFLFFATKLWEEPSLKWTVLAALTGALAAVSKLPFFMAAGLGCFLLTLVQYRGRWQAWWALGAAAAFIGVAFLAWTKHTNHCYARAELPLVDLRISDSETAWWFFGDLKYRLMPGVWIKGGWRVLSALFGSFALAGLFLIGFLGRGASAMARCWLAGGLITTLIFFHLVLHHTHYYLMFAPAVAILCAQAAARLEERLAPMGDRTARAGLVMVMFALGLSTVQGVIGRHAIVFFDPYPAAMANLIRQHTDPSDKLVIQGGGWGGQLLFLSGRKGLSVWDTKLLEDPAAYGRLKSRGFTKLVMVSESPLLAAIKGSTSTRPDVRRETYRKSTTAIVERLPTVLRNEDILIQSLP
jgi:hypothetical protein